MSILDKLSPDEADIYVSLIALGQLTNGELAFIKQKDQQVVSTITGNLVQKGLAKVMPGYIPKIIALYPFDNVIGTADDIFAQLTAEIADLENFVTERGSSIAIEVEKHHEYIEQQLDASQQEITEKSSSATVSLKNHQDDAKNQHDRISGETKGQTEQELVNFVNNTGSKISGVTEGYLSSLEKSTGTVTDTIKGISSGIKSTADEYVQSSIKSKELAEQGIITKTVELAETVASHETGLKEQVDELSKQFSGFIHDTESAIIAEVETEVESTNQETTMIIDKARESLDSSLESLKDSQEQVLKEIATEQQPLTKKTLDEHEIASTEILTSSVQELTEGIQNLSENFTTELTNYKQQLSQLLDGFQQESVKMIDTTRTTIENNAGLMQKDLKTRVIDINTGVNAIVDQKIEIVSGSLATVIAENKKLIIDGLGELGTKLVSRSQQFKENNQDLLRREVETNLEKINQIINKSQEQISNLTSSTVSDIDAHKDSLLAILEDEFQRFSQLMNVNSTKITESTVEMTQHLDQINTEIKNKTVDLKEQLSGETAGVQSVTLTNLTNSINLLAERSTATINLLENESNAAIDEMKTTVVDQLGETRAAMKKGIEGKLSAITEGVEGYATQFKEKANFIQEQVKTLSKAITEVSDKVAGIPPYKPDTQPLHGLESINSYIRGMIERLSAGITIITPKLVWLPVDLIQKSKISQRIQIAIPTSEMDKFDNTMYETESEIIKSFLSKTNVRIRTLEGELDMKYIAADRDGEEVCLGVSGDKSEEIVGIATVNEAYITLFGKIVIGDYFLARAKEVQRSQYGF